MQTDLVLSPFGADPRQLLDAAVAADAGFDGVYTYDHFSGATVGAPWSRDPFVMLGAIAAATSNVRLGVLVANMANRHPAQLASAVNTLQGLAPGRVMCGIGSGAAPGSQFALEQEAIGRRLGTAPERRAELVATIAELRKLWADTSVVTAVTDDAPAPPIVVGGSAEATVRCAAEHADGANMYVSSPEFAALVALARGIGGASFEIGAFTACDLDHPLGGDDDELQALGVDRRTLWLTPPFDVAAIGRVAARLSGG